MLDGGVPPTLLFARRTWGLLLLYSERARTNHLDVSGPAWRCTPATAPTHLLTPDGSLCDPLGSVKLVP